jgi:hypothetical protein
MDEQIHEHIVTRLSRGVNPDEIAYELCETDGLRWPEAEALVQKVQEEKAHSIARRQFPLLFLLGAALFFAGSALLVEGAWTLALALEAMSRPGDADPGKIGLAIAVIASTPEIAARLVFGVGIIGGSIFGMTRAWYGLLYKD